MRSTVTIRRTHVVSARVILVVQRTWSRSLLSTGNASFQQGIEMETEEDPED
uniref:Uncharacterized protein n=1 Tax=Brassica oleracea TaxID=3712 RepID=A0A3P6CSI6_BRAOL|nr:unnamed protein product [Brassica oleracea]